MTNKVIKSPRKERVLFVVQTRGSCEDFIKFSRVLEETLKGIVKAFDIPSTIQTTVARTTLSKKIKPPCKKEQKSR